MKRTIFFLFVAGWLVSCDTDKKEQALQRKEAELNQKEEDLLQRERALQQKEQELMQKERLPDTTHVPATDSITYNPELIGLWTVKMNCIETSCPGSAVGDIKTEHWDISYQDNKIVAKSMAGKQVVRVYSGSYKGNTIELNMQQSENATQPTARIRVQLQQTAKERLEGRREISRDDGCKIVYEVEMVKQ